MVTTSSCSGRVSVFLEGVKDTTKIGSKGNEGRWLYVNHEPEIENWYKQFLFVQDVLAFPSSPLTRFVLYKFEPLILHVKCRDLFTAQELYKTAMNCGFRESGINNNNIVAIRISIKLDVPIGFMDHLNIIVNVNENYLQFLTKLSIDRFTENFKKLNQLEEAIQNMEFKREPVKETKEQRRDRKMREGMARREEVREMKQKKKQEKLAAESSNSK